MAKSARNVVRDILKAQGIWDQEPTDEAVKILQSTIDREWSRGYDDADYDNQMAENFGD